MVRHGVGIIEEKHVEVLLKVGVGLRLTHVLLLASQSIAKQRVRQERALLIVVAILGVAQGARCLAVVVRVDQSLILGRAGGAVEVEVQVRVVVGRRVEGGVLGQGGCGAEVEGQVLP